MIEKDSEIISEKSQRASNEVSKIEDEERSSNLGRTLWDFFSERLGERKIRPPRNWYRLAFYILIFIVLLYATYLVVSGFKGINKGIQHIASGVNSIHEDTKKTTKAIESLTKGPSSSGWFGRHKLDTTACKARGVEAIQRAGGQNINAQQTSTVHANFSNTDGFSYIAVVHCPEDYVVYIYAAGYDVKYAGECLNKIKNQFQITTKK